MAWLVASSASAQGTPVDLTVHPELEGPAPRRLEWREEWGRSGVPNYALIGLGAAVALTNILRAADEERPNRGRNDFDEAARNALRLPVEQQRLIIRDFSDGLLTLMTSTPVLLDALILGAWQGQNEDAAIEMILIDAEVVTFTLALQTSANVLLSRERPYGRTCGGGGPDDLPGESFFCDSPDRYYSFFSGHTSQSFASAAVVCSFHMNMPLMGDGPENMVPCIAAFTGAAATGLFRILGDMHYLSDVLTGAAVGTAVGFLLPWLLHFRDHTAENAMGWPRITFLPNPTGASLFGVF
ncbi:MAG: phosphatase PAP2 family protein [Sandaracinaceae bacterium]